MTDRPFLSLFSWTSCQVRRARRVFSGLSRGYDAVAPRNDDCAGVRALIDQGVGDGALGLDLVCSSSSRVRRIGFGVRGVSEKLCMHQIEGGVISVRFSKNDISVDSFWSIPTNT